MSRHRSSSKRAPPEIGLHMECVEEELEPSQVAYYNKAEKEYNEIQTKLENYIKKMKAEVVEKGENCVVLQVNATSAAVGMASPTQLVSTPTTGGKAVRQSVQTTQNYQQMVGPGILTRSNSNTAGNTYLVMDPRLGFMVGQMQSPNVATEQSSVPISPKVVSTGRNRQNTTGSVMVTTRAKSGLKKQGSASESEVSVQPATRTRDKTKSQTQVQHTLPNSTHQQPVFSTASTSSPGNYKIKVNAKPLTAPSTPNECNALGGLLAGMKTPWKPAPDEASGSKTTPDSREVTFSRLTGKIFPSLVVVARPHLKVKYIPQSNIQQERTALDTKVKGVLMYTTTKFIEWLIQQGLIKSEQFCQTHVKNDQSPVQLKLGMYSDVSKFPYSGGYVWISDCCPSQFVSVFSGSIFEAAPHPPSVLLKLIYHWACQTNVQNVVQWVKVDNLYLKNFYTNMRAVCTQAVYEKFKRMGGPRKKIEVGVISLGTTSQDGNRRQVKVEVLGVLDYENKLIRLRAVEPLSEERSFKKRFVKILEPLKEWVNKESAILTDFTVAKAALNAMGFHNVFQVTNDSKYSNHNVMEYLRRIVPRMFQNTLSLLSRQIIQQFLDELVWREVWGPIPSQAFVNIIAHLAEQTKLDVPESFLFRLNKVAANPFKRWDYAAWNPVPVGTRSGSKVQQKASTPQDSASEGTSESSETPTSVKGIRTRKRAAEQSLETVSPPTSAKRISKTPLKEKVKKEDSVSKNESEVQDKFTDEIIQFLNDGDQIPLESYYYGARSEEGPTGRVSEGSFSVKCSTCNKRFTENIALMKHMILHCQVEPFLVVDLKKVHQCDHCFLGFNTVIALKIHLEEIHSVVDGKLDSNLICHICEKRFKSRNELVYHMHKTHVELEMPYECGVCRFRASVYKVFVDHFIQAHKGDDHVFCPYCLKVVAFSYKGEPITVNVNFYMSHLERHRRLVLLKDCNRCQLSFIHRGILDQHLDADHGSWKNEAGVAPIEGLPSGILMPRPGSVIKPVALAKSSKPPKTKHMFTWTRFKALKIYNIEDDMACLECEGSLWNGDHFSGNFSCSKCRFASCCENAAIEHHTIFHETAQPQFTKGRAIVLPQEMFCVCGYSSSSGNRLAKHLALCEKKSVYSSAEAAAAVVQSVSRSESALDDKIKQGDGQNVLNMLGLVRKSPEVTLVGSESMKMEVSEDLEFETDVKQETSEVEVPETSSQDETETSESQQENSVIDTHIAEVAPKEEDGERKEEGEKLEDSKGGEGTQEDTPAKAPCVLVEEEERDVTKSTETAMEITEEKEESESPPNKLKEGGESEEKMEVDADECEEEKSKEESDAEVEEIREEHREEKSPQNEVAQSRMEVDEIKTVVEEEKKENVIPQREEKQSEEAGESKQVEEESRAEENQDEETEEEPKQVEEESRAEENQDEETEEEPKQVEEESKAEENQDEEAEEGLKQVEEESKAEENQDEEAEEGLKQFEEESKAEENQEEFEQVEESKVEDNQDEDAGREPKQVEEESKAEAKQSGEETEMQMAATDEAADNLKEMEKPVEEANTSIGS